MSSLTIKAIQATKSTFVPCQPEILSIGCTSASLYPKVDLSMTDVEKALVFQHNHKMALVSVNLDQRTSLPSLTTLT
jgi:hypothetical protein